LDQVTEARTLGGQKAFQDALDALEPAISSLPNEHSLHRLKAELLVADGRPREAIASALRVRELNPSDPISELLLGYCYDAAGDKANAEAARNRARRLTQ